jgi:two-component system, OmpR family, sensor histidine kinase SaeS
VIELALIVASAALAAGFAASLVLRGLPTVKLQLAGLALLSATVPLTAVLLSGWVMFHMGADVKILTVTTAAAFASIGAALLLARSIAQRIDRLRAASIEFAGGDLAATAPEEGPAELAQLAATFNEMASRLAALFDARRELVAWASHDLRTPVASMQVMLEALEDGLAQPEDYLPVLRQQVRTLAMLVDDLFELARIDAGALTLELREAEVSGVVEECLSGLEAEARARQVRLEARVEDDSVAWCAPDQVQRVLLNLVTNALRHTPSDGAIAVLVEGRPQALQVTVEDTGDGLDPEAQRRMFERFWRGDAARTSGTAGAGLGLAIARGLVEAQGGRIWAEPRAGGGARVCFTLPRNGAVGPA